MNKENYQLQVIYKDGNMHIIDHVIAQHVVYNPHGEYFHIMVKHRPKIDEISYTSIYVKLEDFKTIACTSSEAFRYRGEEG